MLWLMGGVFTTVGLAVGLTLGGETTLECDRTLPSAQCQITSSSWIETHTQTLPVNQMLGAEVESSHSSDGGYTYRVVMLTQEGRVPLTDVYSSGMTHYSDQAKQINQFLQNPDQPHLRLRQDNRWWGLLFLVAFGGGGLAILFGFGKIVTCEFDKTLGQLMLTRQGLLGGPRQQQYSLRQIVGARVERSHGSDGDTFRSALVLQSGEGIPLTSYYSSGRAKEERTVACISTFLGLSAGEPTIETGAVAVAQVGDVLSMVIGGKSKRQETIADCENQIRQDPYNADTYYTLAMALMMQGEKSQARQALETGRARCMRRGDEASAQRLDKAIQEFGLAA